MTWYLRAHIARLQAVAADLGLVHLWASPFAVVISARNDPQLLSFATFASLRWTDSSPLATINAAMLFVWGTTSRLVNERHLTPMQMNVESYNLNWISNVSIKILPVCCYLSNRLKGISTSAGGIFLFSDLSLPVAIGRNHLLLRIVCDSLCTSCVSNTLRSILNIPVVADFVLLLCSQNDKVLRREAKTVTSQTQRGWSRDRITCCGGIKLFRFQIMTHYGVGGIINLWHIR